MLVTHAKKGVREQRTEGLRKELEGHTAEARAVSKGTSLALLHSYSVGWCRCPKSPCKKQNDLHLDGSKQLSLTGLGLTRSYLMWPTGSQAFDTEAGEMNCLSAGAGLESKLTCLVPGEQEP